MGSDLNITKHLQDYILKHGLKLHPVQKEIINYNLKLGDTKKIQLGNSQDLQIYHDGSHSWFKNTTGRLLLQTDGDQIQLRGNTIVAFNGAASTEYLRIDSSLSLIHI